jgi:hypothetical protein
MFVDSLSSVRVGDGASTTPTTNKSAYSKGKHAAENVQLQLWGLAQSIYPRSFVVLSVDALVLVGVERDDEVIERAVL